MVPWSAFIGWRRYLQGMLIRQGRTRVIGVGTTLRVLTIIASAGLLYLTTAWSGIVIASSALLVSVIVECLFIHWASRGVVRDVVRSEPADGLRLTLKQLAAFHFPLSATTMVKLLVTPIIVAGLARTGQPVLAIASFQVASTIMWLHRAMGLCLPEVVIALYQDSKSRIALRNFTTAIAVGTSGSMLLMSVTGIDAFIFSRVLNASPEIVSLARAFFLATALAPALDAVQGYVRGVLTAHHLTVSRLTAVAVSVGVMLATVQIAVVQGCSGPVIAGLALTASLVAELGVLVFSWAHAQSRSDLRTLS